MKGSLPIRDKADLLARSAVYDLCGSCSSAGGGRIKDPLGRWIYPAALPDGRTVRLLKVLQTNLCRNDCSYCANRASRDVPRERFSPEELARLFMDLSLAGIAQGLFLSSAVEAGPDHGMARMIATAEIVRKRFEFNGYIHLKILPGASQAAIEHAATLADRISINIEAPGPDALSRIARQKDFRTEILPQTEWIRRAVEDRRFRARSHTTQFVVGAGGESDRDILRWCEWLYTKRRLSRAYFSAYQVPDEDTPLTAAPAPLMREHRLYQADFLMRRYGFCYDELEFEPSGNLSLEVDPKQKWADRHPEWFPVDILTADFEQLVRVPGIGPLTAKRICTLRAQRQTRFTTASDLRRAGVILERAARYVVLGGRRLEPPPPAQMDLPFPAADECGPQVSPPPLLGLSSDAPCV